MLGENKPKQTKQRRTKHLHNQLNKDTFNMNIHGIFLNISIWQNSIRIQLSVSVCLSTDKKNVDKEQTVWTKNLDKNTAQTDLECSINKKYLELPFVCFIIVRLWEDSAEVKLSSKHWVLNLKYYWGLFFPKHTVKTICENITMFHWNNKKTAWGLTAVLCAFISDLFHSQQLK